MVVVVVKFGGGGGLGNVHKKLSHSNPTDRQTAEEGERGRKGQRGKLRFWPDLSGQKQFCTNQG